MTEDGYAELADDPQWYRDAVIYELHVRAYRDSNADGIGDFAGLTQKLDYLQDLGVTALWLLPFYPSPLRDDGYDIADYASIHPDYGTMRQFRRFVSEAHRRGMRVINELVINHTSDEHPWFQRAVRSGPGTRWGDWYVWSDTPERYPEARIIFQDFETSNWSWHPRAGAYYWHRFYSHQPDLNFENPEVREAVKKELDFWAETGVDGMRLDAIPYLFEQEGTNCENLPETHEFLKELRKHLDANHRNRMFLAEANQWPEDAAAYFGDGDECHMNFHFPLMPRLFMALRQEDRFPILDILEQTPEIGDGCQWALFLRNHDELTLEMVTDEERDYMYRAYAHDPRMRINLGIRRRLAPLVQNSRPTIELLNGLLFSLPGTPVLYYGDEIGMGDNIYLGDRNGVRTPMQWSADRNAGFSAANPQRLYLPVIIDPEYHYETVNVEAQHNNSRSLLWWTKRLIALRKRTQVFGRGSIRFLLPDNPKVLAFVREHEDEKVLVVANLSRYAQACELDLSEYRGLALVEMFGATTFPPIVDRPYVLTLGPHAFYWFWVEPPSQVVSLSPRVHEREVDPEVEVPEVTVGGAWTALLKGRGSERLAAVLPDILRARRWFGGKARPIRAIAIRDVIALGRNRGDEALHLVVAHVEYVQGDPEEYVLPVAFAAEEAGDMLASATPHAVLARVRGQGKGRSGVLYDALWDADAGRVLLETVARGRRSRAGAGEVLARRAPAFGRTAELGELTPTVLRVEQSNTSVVYGDRFVLKVVRRLEAGRNPDLEVGEFLTARARFAHSPAVAGSIEYRPDGEDARTIAILQRYVPNEGDAWSYTLDELDRFCERILTDTSPARPALGRAGDVLALTSDPAPEQVHDLVGPYLQTADLLGQRTADLHRALASDPEDPAFAPEPFTTLYQRSLYQSMRTTARRELGLLRKGIGRLPKGIRPAARELVGREDELLERFEAVRRRRIETSRIRIHGDFHLGQILYTGRDFVIIDFEGEPARPLGERRIKRSPLRDVAGMLRSFHYATYAALFEQQDRGIVAPGSEVADDLQEWLGYWNAWVSATFLRRYLEAAAGAVFLPEDPDDVRVLLEAYLLEKAVYELAYELNNRPEWVRIPLQGAMQLLDAER